MLLADLEQPGGTLINPVKAPMHLLLPVALKLVPTVLPAGAVSEGVHSDCTALKIDDAFSSASWLT